MTTGGTNSESRAGATDPYLAWRREIDQRVDAFEWAWKRTSVPAIEDFVLDLPAAQLGMLIRELVEIDLYYRRNRGEDPVVAMYTARFPQYAGMLQELVWKQKPTADLCEPPGPGERVGEFVVEQPVGHGAMGLVFRARRRDGGEPVALKVSRFSHGRNWKLAERFKRESDLLSRLRHPHIVEHIAYGVWQRWQYFAIELLPGPSLRQMMNDRGALPVPEAIRYARDLLSALRHLERERIVHREVQPANAMLDAGGRLKLIDFGLARSLVGDENLSSTGRLMGVPEYLSPEALAGSRGDVGHESDVFSAMCVLYHLLAGVPPFPTREREEATEVSPLTARPLRTIRPSIPRDVETLVRHALSLNPVERISSSVELSDELLRYQRCQPLHCHDYSLLQTLGRKIRGWKRILARDRD
ncbi:MAG: serine/threonine-protein kinase [Planctomycetota bacterium]|nr:serine/threonine-protein kinase [Planctomycetota bacterium]